MTTKLFARLARARLARPAAVVALALTALGPGSTSISTTAADTHQPYVVALGGAAAVKADRPIAEVESALRERQRADVMAELARETSAGKAADASYDADAHAVRVGLSEAARVALSANRPVASIEPAAARERGRPGGRRRHAAARPTPQRPGHLVGQLRAGLHARSCGAAPASTA